MAAHSAALLDLEWWTEQFETEHLASLSDLADGVLFMQLLDALFPGSVELHRLNLSPLTVDERERNLQLFQASVRRLVVETGEIDVSRLARGDEEALARLAHTLKTFTEASADRLDAIDSYPALKVRMEARALAGPSWGGARRAAPDETSAPSPERAEEPESPKVSQRRDELGQLIDCLKQELTKRMQTLEELQAEFYEVRHERGLLFSALQRVERICVQMCEADPADPLAGDLLALVAETPEDWKPAVADHDGEEGGGYAYAHR
jgi:hypothetical protein